MSRQRPRPVRPGRRSKRPWPKTVTLPFRLRAPPLPPSRPILSRRDLSPKTTGSSTCSLGSASSPGRKSRDWGFHGHPPTGELPRGGCRDGEANAACAAVVHPAAIRRYWPLPRRLRCVSTRRSGRCCRLCGRGYGGEGTRSSRSAPTMAPAAVRTPRPVRGPEFLREGCVCAERPGTAPGTGPRCSGWSTDRCSLAWAGSSSSTSSHGGPPTPVTYEPLRPLDTTSSGPTPTK